MTDQTLWDRHKFPTRDIDTARWPWFANEATIKKPICWTPTKPFQFGGRRFIALYPCIAFATLNAGNIIQRLPNSLVLGREY